MLVSFTVHKMQKGVTHIAQKAIVRVLIFVVLALTVAFHYEATIPPVTHATAVCCPPRVGTIPATGHDAHVPVLTPGDDPALKKTDAIVTLRLLPSRHAAQTGHVSLKLSGWTAAAAADVGGLPGSDRQILNCSLLM